MRACVLIARIFVVAIVIAIVVSMTVGFCGIVFAPFV